MKVLLILPNYQQNETIPVLVFSDGKWTLSDYNQAISPLRLEKGCARGIPAPILKKLQPEEMSGFVLGQLLRRNQKNNFFLKSCVAGHDSTSRIVFLTAIFEFSPSIGNGTSFSIPGGFISALNEATTYKITTEQQDALSQAVKKLNDPNEASRVQLSLMWNNFNKNPNFKHFTSVRFSDSAYYIPDSEREGGLNRGNDSAPLSKELKLLLLILLGAALMSFLVWMTIHLRQ